MLRLKLFNDRLFSFTWCFLLRVATAKRHGLLYRPAVVIPVVNLIIFRYTEYRPIMLSHPDGIILAVSQFTSNVIANIRRYNLQQTLKTGRA